jgi:hypothetical protein
MMILKLTNRLCLRILVKTMLTVIIFEIEI